MDQPQEIFPHSDENALTSIHDAYTVSATQDGRTGEVNQLMVRNFIDTLAEVALSLASRRVAK